MSPITHFLTGWVLANSAGLNRRDRALAGIAGIIPDVDGLGLVADVASRGSAHPLTWWSDYHHVLGHNVGFCLLVGVLAWGVASNKWKTVALSTASFHLHLLGDLVGARGPDGEQWPIPYLLPFSSAWQWTWSGQWALNAWPNMAITALLLLATLYFAWQRGVSPLELVSARANQAVVETLRRRFGPSPGKGEAE